MNGNPRAQVDGTIGSGDGCENCKTINDRMGQLVIKKKKKSGENLLWSHVRFVEEFHSESIIGLEKLLFIEKPRWVSSENGQMITQQPRSMIKFYRFAKKRRKMKYQPTLHGRTEMRLGTLFIFLLKLMLIYAHHTHKDTAQEQRHCFRNFLPNRYLSTASTPNTSEARDECWMNSSTVTSRTARKTVVSQWLFLFHDMVLRRDTCGRGSGLGKWQPWKKSLAFYCRARKCWSRMKHGIKKASKLWSNGEG